MRYNLDPAQEIFESRLADVDKIAKTVKHFTKAQFKLNVKPGDVLIAYSKKSKITGLSLITKWANKLVQGSSFTSCKVVGKDAKEIIGYEASLKSLTLNTSPIDKFMTEYEIALVLSHNTATEEQLKKVVDYMYDKKNKKVPYAFGKAFISVFKHWFGSDVESMEKPQANGEVTVKDKTEPDPISVEQEKSLFCSSVVCLAYRAAGIKLQFTTDIEDDYVWPRDILLSKSFTITGGWFSKESGVTAPK